MDPQNEWPQIERRSHDREFAVWREHVDRRLDKQDSMLQEIRDAMGASKIGLAAIRWLAGVGAAVAAIWGAIHLGPPK